MSRLVGDEVVEGEGLVGWGGAGGADAEAGLVAVNVVLGATSGSTDRADDDVGLVGVVLGKVDADETASLRTVAGTYIDGA